MYTKRNNRRQFLKIASSLLAAPLGSMTSYAQAQTVSTAPLRYVAIADSGGLHTLNRNISWMTRGQGNYALQASDLGRTLAPLEKYRENLLVTTGVNYLSSTRIGDGPNHNVAPNHVLMGSARGQHESFDVRMGDMLHSSEASSGRIFPFVNFTDRAEPNGFGVSYDRSGVLIRPFTNVQTAVDSLFGDAEAATDPALRAEVLARTDILAGVSERVRTLKSELGVASFSEKLDAYDQSVGDLATQIELQLNAEGCAVPSFGSNELTAAGYPSNRADTLTLIAQMFSCDMVSAATWTIGGEQFNRRDHPFLSSDSAVIQALLDREYHRSTHVRANQAWQSQTIIRTHHADMIVDFIDRLAATPDVDGSSVFDNTVISYNSMYSTNVHSRNNYANFYIAGKNTGLRGGRHYDLRGESNNDVWLTLAAGLGQPIGRHGGVRSNGQVVAGLNNGPIEAMLK